MRVIILGGSASHLGGVETFSDRAEAALKLHAPDVSVERLWTETAYLLTRRLPLLVRGLFYLCRSRLKGKGIVWLQYVNLPDLIYLLAAKVLGFRVVVTPHLGSNWKSQRKPALRRLSSTLLEFSDSIALLASTQAAEIALPSGPPRCFIKTFLPLNVLEGSGPEKDETQSLRLVHASRLSEDKGTFLMVDVCRALHTAGVPFSAEIIGASDHKTFNRLQMMIADADLGDKVDIVGWVSADEIVNYLRRADILVHLSNTDSYPLIVLEALACGMLPVALDLAGARDIIRSRDGWIVSRSTAVEDAADRIQRVALPELRRRGARQIDRVRVDFAWESAVDILVTALSATDGRAARVDVERRHI